MASAGPGGAAVALPRPRSAEHVEPSDLTTVAWLWAVPCALLTYLLVDLLGPPLGEVLYPEPLPVLPTVEHNPEFVEATRYLLSLAGPVMLAAGIALLAPRVRVPRALGAALALTVQLAAVGFVTLCVLRQFGDEWQIEFFTAGQVLAAAVTAPALAFAARRGWLTRRLREPRWLAVAVPVLAAVLTGIWFLSSLNDADKICYFGDCYNTAFMVDETFAVLNGLTPLVDHTAAYGSLWPLLLAPLMSIFGATLLTWTFLMWGLTIAMLLALFGVLRRVTRSSLWALALFLPLMTFVYYASARDLDAPIAIYQQVPLRTAGPFLVAWLVARRLERGHGATWPLFLAAGLATLNNADFGIAALGATVAALLWTAGPLTWRAAGRVAGSAAIGLAAAYALVAVVTLLRAGALPNPAKAVEFARIYSLSGVGVWPLGRLLGLSFVIYLTYAAAIGVATVRALRGAQDRTLTGMLAWSAIFGFGSAAYYMGATTILAIATLFPPWALSLTLLAVVAVRETASRRDRLPTVPALAALFGFALTATFVFMPPARFAPWSQADRLTTELSPYAPADAEPLAAPDDAAFRRFVGEVPNAEGEFVVREGAPVALFTASGHQLAEAYGLRDVVPFTGRSVFTQDQFDAAIERLREAGGSTVIVPAMILPRVAALLEAHGFRVLTSDGWRTGVPGETIPDEEVVKQSAGVIPDELTKWVDARALAGDGKR